MFGLALSLGAFVLISQPPMDTNHLYTGILIFGFSFLILVNVWHSYTNIMVALPIETRALLVLNVLLLFAVAIEPYLLNVIAFNANSAVVEAASVLYASDIAAMNVVLACFMHVMTQEERALLSGGAARLMRIRRDFTLGFGAVFALSTLPFFWQWIWLGYPSRLVLWTLTIPAGWLIRAVTKTVSSGSR